MNDDERTLFRARNRVRYAEFRTMPSKVVTAAVDKDSLSKGSA
jgi:hypothetical protein